MWLLVGLPAAGKSTIADPIVEREGALLIDADEAKKRLPEYNGGILADAVHEESSSIAGAILKKAQESNDNIVLPVVGRNRDSLQNKIEKFKTLGYEVNLIYVDIPMDEAIRRASNRFKEQGRLIKLSYLEDIGTKPKNNYDLLKTSRG